MGVVEGREVVVGIGQLRVERRVETGDGGSVDGLSMAEDEGEGGEEEETGEADDFVRVQVHCGYNFFLGSAFHV